MYYVVRAQDPTWGTHIYIWIMSVRHSRRGSQARVCLIARERDGAWWLARSGTRGDAPGR
eukprot:5698904-Prymnesium_polylepis.2